MIFILLWSGFILGVGVATVVNPPEEKPVVFCTKDDRGLEKCFEVKKK
jgi:hypothetical protein